MKTSLQQQVEIVTEIQQSSKPKGCLALRRWLEKVGYEAVIDCKHRTVYTDTGTCVVCNKHVGNVISDLPPVQKSDEELGTEALEALREKLTGEKRNPLPTQTDREIIEEFITDAEALVKDGSYTAQGELLGAYRGLQDMNHDAMRLAMQDMNITEAQKWFAAAQELDKKITDLKILQSRTLRPR